MQCICLFLQAWKRFNQNLDELTYSLQLWAGHLKKIEGNFGSGVTSYFRFIKWLFLINISLFFLVFSFVTLPQLLHRYLDLGGYANNTDFSFEHIFTGSVSTWNLVIFIYKHYLGYFEFFFYLSCIGHLEVGLL